MARKRILLVEDNPDDVELTLRAFRKEKMEEAVAVVRDGAAAIEYLMEPARELPDIVLLDLKLPKLDGVEVLRILRGDVRTRMLPVVILTSSKEERDIVAAYGLGANSYIQKPVDYVKFLEVVHQLNIYWLGLNQGPPCRSGNPE